MQKSQQQKAIRLPRYCKLAAGGVSLIVLVFISLGSAHAAPTCTFGLLCQYDAANYIPSGPPYPPTYDKPTLEWADNPAWNFGVSGNATVVPGQTIDLRVGYDSIDPTVNSEQVITWVNIPGGQNIFSAAPRSGPLGTTYDSDQFAGYLNQCFNVLARDPRPTFGKPYSGAGSPYYNRFWFSGVAGGKIFCDPALDPTALAAGQPTGSWPGGPWPLGHLSATGTSAVWRRGSEAGSFNNARHDLKLTINPALTSPTTFCMRGHVSVLDANIPFDVNNPSAPALGNIMGITGTDAGGSSMCFNVAIPPPPPPAPPILGVDQASCTSVSGWAFDADNPATSITVFLYADSNFGPQVYSTVADNSRPDINATFGIAGSHGFSFNMPPELQNGVAHVFYVYAIDNLGDNTGASLHHNPPGDERVYGPDPVGMASGCGAFTVTPSATGSLAPTSEDPTQFCADATITVSYPGVAGYPAWAAAPPNLFPVSTSVDFTKNGSPAGSVSPGSTFAPGSTNVKPCVPTGVTGAGDHYCTNLRVSPISGLADSTGQILVVFDPGPQNSGSCDTVVNKPYFRAYNGGLSAGGNFPSSTTPPSKCDGGGILGGWNNNTGSPAPPFGSGTGLAAIALIKITGVASAKATALGAVTASNLNFSNTTPAPLTTSADSPALGGAFAGNHCFTELTAPDGTPTLVGTSVDISALANGPQKTTAAITSLNGGAPLAPGSNRAIYVDGNNVYINSDITYATVPWLFNPASPNASSVPSFSLIVHGGNIYIGPNVTQLDGIYEAIKTPGGVGGNIYTCGTSGFTPMTAGSLYGSCNNQLTVNGAFVANGIKLMRTYGSLRNDKTGAVSPCANAGIISTPGTCSAEVFRFSPEIYLSNQPIKKPANGANVFDSLTSLPPVL